MKVYFNNSCKICKAEIDLYKKEKIDEIDWVDITNNELAEKETSKARQAPTLQARVRLLHPLPILITPIFFNASVSSACFLSTCFKDGLRFKNLNIFIAYFTHKKSRT